MGDEDEAGVGGEFTIRQYRAVELLNTKVYLHGDVAIFTGDHTETGTREGVEYSEAGLFSETWVKRKGQWVIVGSVFP